MSGFKNPLQLKNNKGDETTYLFTTKAEVRRKFRGRSAEAKQNLAEAWRKLGGSWRKLTFGNEIFFINMAEAGGSYGGSLAEVNFRKFSIVVWISLFRKNWQNCAEDVRKLRGSTAEAGTPKIESRYFGSIL